MQWVPDDTETVIIKPSSLNTVTQGLSTSLPDPSLSPYTCLYLEWALTRLQASWLAESTTRKKEVAQHLHFTHSQARFTVTRNTTHLPYHWGCALDQPVRQASALVREGARASTHRKEKKERLCISAAYAVAWCPSVCHVHVFCRNE